MPRRASAKKQRGVQQRALKAAEVDRRINGGGRHEKRLLLPPNWTDDGATEQRAIERYETDHGARAEQEFHSGMYGDSDMLGMALCTGCGKTAAAVLCIRNDTPARSTAELCRYSFWRLEESGPRYCACSGQLPDPISLTGELGIYHRSRHAQFKRGAEGQDITRDTAGSYFKVRITP